MVLARQAAIKAVKRQLQRQGLRKPTRMSPRELTVLAEDYIAQHRTRLITEAREIVERWEAEGFFGKRAQRASLERFAQTAKP